MTREAVRAAAVDPATTFETVLGPVKFDEVGDTSQKIISLYKADLTAADGKGDWVFDEQVDYARVVASPGPEREPGSRQAPRLFLSRSSRDPVSGDPRMTAAAATTRRRRALACRRGTRRPRRSGSSIPVLLVVGAVGCTSGRSSSSTR